MTRRGPRFARLRRRFGLGAKPGPGPAEPQRAAEPAEPRAGPGAARPAPAPPPPPPPPPPAAIRGGLGERPAAATGDQAAEAELDTLRGELVRELDKMSRRAAS